MEFELEGVPGIIKAELILNKGFGDILFKINNKEYDLKLLKSSGSNFEFILGNSFYQVKILHSEGTKYSLDVDGITLEVKKHSKLTEIIEKSRSKSLINQENNVSSQIPGRVVKISVSQGSGVKKGDPIMILESMKMQVAIKAHKDGTLKEIKAKEGSIIARNDVVAVIE
ncbi:MAG: acetyl-CoA carboxylase biotin carboxyl carrier protein subunit [Nitrososphaeraceae archaeon]|nr:acetyl-CoA carboxylase biotin carboxyl carrier protein subunit [Nitrososphaeraceae archaeon]